MKPFLILPFSGILPTFGGEPVFAGARSAVLGRATIGARAWLGEDSVVRADGEEVRIGDDVHLSRRATVHIVHETTPAIIGSNVTVGQNSIVHACTIGDDCVIENDVTVLDDAIVEGGVLIQSGSTVFPRKKLDAGWTYAGSPAVPLHRLEPGELASRRRLMRARQESERALSADVQDFGDAVFVASTVQRAGRLACAPGSSLFFSCVVDAGTGSIFIDRNTNIQDNTIIRAGHADVTIGADTTIGHNVRMGGACIGARSLVGIGVVLGEGSVVEDDVLLAAGATTTAGQVLGSGWMWGGRPAKPISRLDESRRAGMAANVATYCEYSQAFRRLQQHAS